MILLALFIFGLIVFLSLTLTVRNYRTQRRPAQREFLRGEVPTQMPDGLYRGSVGVQTSWKGKKFNREKQIGINVFEENGKSVEKYPFVTYVAKGVKDRQLDVIKIDYNIETNPFWLRLILDEVVEVEPGKFLGKVHIKFGPFVFALGYFELQK